MLKKFSNKNWCGLNLKGFTLIELLVVIAIIALLLAILMPSLQMVKKKASTAVCLTNTKNLSLAWYMYQEDNDGWIVGGQMSRVVNGRNIGWIRKPQRDDGSEYEWWTSAMVTDEEEFRGIRAGALYSYYEDVKLLHCPSDNTRRSVFSGGKPYASYVVPDCLNGNGNSGGGHVQKFNKITSPSSRYNFIESAEEREYNGEGRFLMRLNPGNGFRGYTWMWWSPLAVIHGDSSTFGYCDGHSEVRKWRDEYTISHTTKLDQNNGTYGSHAPPPEQVEDIRFMAQGWTIKN